MKCVLALDQGTTSSRAILFDHSGKVYAVSQREFKQHYPRPGWVEHDPEAIWETQQSTARSVMHQAGAHREDIQSIGITNQRETTIVWNRKTGRAIYNAIVWQDRRTAEHCNRLREEGAEPFFNERTGLTLDPYFSGTKIRWILDHVEGARAQAERGELAFGTIDSWLIWKLTGGQHHVTDPSNASRTLLFNIHSMEWDSALLDRLDIPASMLPEVKTSSGIHGHAAADQVAGGCPIAGIAGDQQAALFGQACFSPGSSKNTYGTGCFLLMNTGNKPVASKNRLLTTVAWSRNGTIDYALEGSVFMGGAVVQWLRDGLGIIESSADVQQLAETVPDTGGVLLVPAFAGLGAPHWDPHARGTIIGLTRGSTKAHIARAALESMCFQSKEVLEAMIKDSGTPIHTLRVDGGASSNDLLMQIQADLLQVPVERPKRVETTAFGAAALAGLAVGFWNNPDEIAAHVSIDRVFEPAISAEEARERYARWLQAVERSKNWEP